MNRPVIAVVVLVSAGLLVGRPEGVDVLQAEPVESVPTGRPTRG